MKDINKFPTCDKADCAGCQDGHCIVLTNNKFDKECPFYKTKEQAEKEQAYRAERLAKIFEEEDYYA